MLKYCMLQIAKMAVFLYVSYIFTDIHIYVTYMHIKPFFHTVYYLFYMHAFFPLPSSRGTLIAPKAKWQAVQKIMLIFVTFLKYPL